MLSRCSDGRHSGRRIVAMMPPSPLDLMERAEAEVLAEYLLVIWGMMRCLDDAFLEDRVYRNKKLQDTMPTPRNNNFTQPNGSRACELRIWARCSLSDFTGTKPNGAMIPVRSYAS